MSDPGYEDLYVNVKHDLKNVAGRCFVAPGTRNTRTRTRGNYDENTAGGSGAFGDDGRHAPKPFYLQATVERVNERNGIWRPLLNEMNRI